MQAVHEKGTLELPCKTLETLELHKIHTHHHTMYRRWRWKEQLKKYVFIVNFIKIKACSCRLSEC